MTEKKLQNIAWSSYLYMFLLFACGVGFCYMSLMTSQQWSDICINCVALAIMMGFICYGVGTRSTQRGILPLLVCVGDLAMATQCLKESKKDAWTSLFSLLGSGGVELKSQQLTVAVEGLRHEYQALSQSNAGAIPSSICDVEAFINEDLLDDVSNAAFSEFIASALTGLGILGTFVGLVVGLQSFQTGSAEAINNSIAPLIDGMKIAFYTSIFGVTLSVLYGLFFRHSKDRAQAALQTFLSEFYQAPGAHPQNEAISKLLGYQQEQSDNLKEFVDTISIKLGEAVRDALLPALATMPAQFSAQLQATIVPSLERMEQSFGGLVEAIGQSQSNGMDKIVQYFIDEMNRCLGDQMQTLGASIESLCKWQSDTVEALDLVITRVCTSGEQLDGINENLGKTLTVFMNYVTQLDQTQTEMTKRCETMMQQAQTTLSQFAILGTQMEASLDQNAGVVTATGEICAAIESQETLLQTMLEQQREQLKKDTTLANAQLEEMKTVCATMLSRQKQLFDQANGSFQAQTKLLGEMCNKTTGDMEAAANHLTKSTHGMREELDGALASSFAQFDQQLALSIEHFSGTLTQLKESTQELSSVVESTPKMVDATTSAMQKRMQTQLQETAKAQEAFIRTICQSIQSMETTLTKMRNNTRG